MIAIIDYGLGNIKAFEHIYRRLDIPVRIVSRADDIGEGADRYILPGVGSFDWAMRLLKDSGILPTLQRKVFEERCPVLGVCVGMQMLFDQSEEGIESGLCWIKGSVKKLQSTDGSRKLRLPHMGWNTIKFANDEPLFLGLGKNPDFYFLHAYAAAPELSSTSIATADYHGNFAAAVRSGHIMGTQFHPEKSHENGRKVLENFAKGEV